MRSVPSVLVVLASVAYASARMLPIFRTSLWLALPCPGMHQHIHTPYATTPFGGPILGPLLCGPRALRPHVAGVRRCSKSCGNNTLCCSEKRITLAKGGGV